MQHIKSVSIVIPVYKSTESVRELCEELSAVAERERLDFEIVLVDDGNTSEIGIYLDALCVRHHNLVVVHLSRNYGQHAAVLAGINIATREWVITIDDDLQHSPSDIPKLIDVCGSQCDLVYAVPIEQNHGKLRGLLSQCVKKIIALDSQSQHIGYHSAFRLFRRSLLTSFSDLRQPIINIDQMLAWKTTKVSRVDVVHNVRRFGTSNYSVQHLVRHAVYLLLNFTTWPLKMASVLGFMSCIVSFAILCFVVIQRIVTGTPVPGFAFIASSVVFFGGIQLLSIGIIGEYISQIFIRTSDQPTYSVGSTVSWTSHHGGIE